MLIIGRDEGQFDDLPAGLLNHWVHESDRIDYELLRKNKDPLLLRKAFTTVGEALALATIGEASGQSRVNHSTNVRWRMVRQVLLAAERRLSPVYSQLESGVALVGSAETYPRWFHDKRAVSGSEWSAREMTGRRLAPQFVEDAQVACTECFVLLSGLISLLKRWCRDAEFSAFVNSTESATAALMPLARARFFLYATAVDWAAAVLASDPIYRPTYEAREGASHG